MKIDLHVHTMERSPCAHASEDEQIEAAIRAGLDAICITDHWQLVPPERLRSLNLRHAPLRIYGGIEVTAEGEDLLVLGVQDRFLETAEWDYAALHAYVRERQGFLILAHPYRYHAEVRIDLAGFPPDAIELHSPNTPTNAEADIRRIAQALNVPLLSSSDAHTVERIGSYYISLDGSPEDEQDLFDLLRAGQFSRHCP